MPMIKIKSEKDVADMLSELEVTQRDEGAGMKSSERIYVAGLMRSLRYVLGLEDTLSDEWRQARIPTPPAELAVCRLCGRPREGHSYRHMFQPRTD